MSKNLDNHKLELINSTLIPKWYNCLYSSEQNILIYSISSDIVVYNLSDDTKKIINNKDKLIISNMKYLDKEKNILLIINKNQFPVLNILSINKESNDMNNSYIYSKIIPVEENFNVSNIFVDRFRYNLFLILLSGINKNILYFFHLTNITNNQYSLIPIGKLQKLDIEVIDFKTFYNTDLIICATRNSLIYYKINLENQACSLYKKIQFHLSIKTKSLKIDRKNGFISILTLRGECLVYDKDGNNITSLKCPLNNNEYFGFHIFSEFNNSLCLATNKGNILIYNIENKSYEGEYNFKIKKFIKYSNINQIIKEKYYLNKNEINNNDNSNDKYENNNNIEIIYYNERNNLIMIYKNSLLTVSLFDVFNKNLNKNSIILHQYNHNQKINNGIIIYKAALNPNMNIDLNYDNIIYTCSNNNILNSCYYIHSKNKFISQNFNFNNILPNNEVHITSIRFHPKYSKDILYAGDNQGFLYIINKQRNFDYQKYNLNDVNNDNNSYENAINLIMFSPASEYIIYIGFNNGLQKLYDLKVDKNFNYYKLLANEFFDKNEIQYRKNKSHVINFCYFFIYKNNLRDCFAYLSSQKLVKIAKFENENNICISSSYNNEVINIKYNDQILDIKIHNSENYIITLNNKRQIILKDIYRGNIISILDMNKYMNYIYNLELDISGLYMSIICDFKSNNKNKIYDINSNKSSLAIIEINSGQIQNYVKETNNIITKTKFDYYGRYLITLGEKGEISTWRLNKEINNKITKSIEKIRENFFEFWENYKVRNQNNLDFDVNEDIMDEILTEDLINKEKYILDIDNYINQEDFFKINNHGEKSIFENKSKTNSFLVIDNSISNRNINNSRSMLNNNNYISNDNKSKNKLIDYSLEQDHYINRNKYNYKNSANYIKNSFKNNYNKKGLEIEIEKSNSNITKRTSSFSDKNKNDFRQKKEQIIYSSHRNKSFRDIILKAKTSRNKEININKDTKNLETPHFNHIPTNPMDNIDLRLFSFNSNNEDDKDIFDLKKKIIKQSSNLLYNQRRMINLNNAMNKIKTKNSNIVLNTNSNSKISNLEETKKENDSFNNKLKMKNDRYINLGELNYQEDPEKFNFRENHKKYPEPSDIDNNLINIDTKLFKNDRNLIKLENKDDISNENLFFINNKSGNNLINNNMNISNNSYSISLIKEIQNNNNNSIFGKNNSNINFNKNNNHNEYDITNITNNNISVGEQISYLENNIKRFEKTFGK